MHSKLSRRRGDDGAVAIIVAVCLTALLVLVAMVLDFGLVRVDRQVDKSAADAATVAGLHGLNTGDGKWHPYAGVCNAIRYLKKNNDRFSSVDESTGWSNGLDVSTGNGCGSSLAATVCDPNNLATWAKFSWSGTYAGKPLQVKIQSGYVLNGSTGWSEDNFSVSTADTGDSAQKGCDQLAVTITQARKPGLGSLATSADLVSSIRSVGRVAMTPGGYAPALLLLKQHGCPVLDAGSASGDSFIHVLGDISTDKIVQPGSIHADSDAAGSCSGGSNQNVFLGTGSDGIVAYAAPLVDSPGTADPTKPGQITSYAAFKGKASNFVYDSLNNVYGSNALTSGGTKTAPSGRDLVTRAPVDKRYRLGVVAAIGNAQGVFVAGLTSSYLQLPTAKKADPCKPTQADIDSLALDSSKSLYVDCDKFIGDSGGLTIPAGTVYFKGSVNPAGTLSMPNASHVYVANGKGDANAIDIGNNASFQMNNQVSNLTGTTCSNGQNSSKAELFVKSGSIKQGGTSKLQLCRTTVFMMGGDNLGCVPGTDGTAPTSTPCPGINGGLGTGQFTQTGGDIDWTAPDVYDVTRDSNGNDLPALSTPGQGWTDPNGPEDLALWSESATNNSNTYNMNGGGAFHVRGVFMVPNADPFNINGGANMNLKNAQFIATSISLSGAGTHVTMQVDPNSAITLPQPIVIGLVR